MGDSMILEGPGEFKTNPLDGLGCNFLMKVSG